MCWIAIANWDRLKEILSEQKDRWLDSLWIFNNGAIHKITASKFKDYKTFLFKNNFKGLSILHHRKATIWDITLENAHPFKGKKFILMQNWTATSFHKAYKVKYWKEVDTHNLLCYIEENANTLEEVVVALTELWDMFQYDDFWNIIVVEKTTHKVLFISDWTRESYIDYNKEKVNLITNYEPWKKRWYKNVWFIIFDMDWIIEKDNFVFTNLEEFIGFSQCLINYYNQDNKLDDYQFDWKWIYSILHTKEWSYWDYWAEKKNILNFFLMNEYVYKYASMEDVYTDYMAEAWYVWEPKNFWLYYSVDYPKDFFKNIFNTYSPLYFK